MSTNIATNLAITAIDNTSVTLNKISMKLIQVTNTVNVLNVGLDKATKDKSRWDKFRDGVDKAAAAVSHLKNKTFQALDTFNKVATGATNFAVTAADTANKVGSLATKYQVNANAMQVFGAMVEGQGGSMEEAAASMGNLNNAMSAAAAGGEKQTAAFSKLGLSVSELKNLQPHQIMERIAEAGKGAAQGSEKQAALLELLGENSKNAVNVITQGADAYSSKYAEMQKNGQLFSDSQLVQARNFDKTWKNMTGTFGALKSVLGLQVAEKIGPIVDKIQQWVVTNKDLISTKLGEFLDSIDGDDVANTLTGMLDITLKLAGALGTLIGFLGPTNSALLGFGISMLPSIGSAIKLAETISSLSPAIGKFALKAGEMASGALPALMSGLRAVWAIMLANPMMIIMAAVAALAAVIYANWDSIVAYISGAWERIKSVFSISFFAGFVQIVMELFQGMANGILGIVKSMVPDSLMPDWLKNAKVDIAGTMAANLGVSAQSAEKLAGKTNTAANTPVANAGATALATTEGTAGPARRYTAVEAAQNKSKIEGYLKIHVTGEKHLCQLTSSGNIPIQVNSGVLNAGGA